jgi:hypothetical protein
MAEVSAHLSRLFAGTRPLAAADGVTRIPVRIRLRDVNDEPAVGYQVTLFTDDPDATITQPPVTDARGYAVGFVTSTVDSSVNIHARVEAPDAEPLALMLPVLPPPDSGDAFADFLLLALLPPYVPT